MKILITNHWLKKIGGSETFTYTLAAELKRQGNDVNVFTNEIGIVSSKIKAKGIPVYSDVNMLNDSYDLILANHRTTVNQVKDRGYIIQTIHGLSSKLEHPSFLSNEFVVISEELQKAIPLKSEVILNGIDCRRFYPEKPINQKIKKVLSLSFSECLNKRLNSIFVKKGIQFNAFNKFKNPVWDIENHINDADLVISLGRGCYEALACGRPVLVLDDRKYQGVMGDGLLTPDNIQRSIKFNCSGRAFIRVDIDNMVNESLGKYDSSLSEFYRDYALKNLNIEIQSKKYIEIFSSQSRAVMG